MKNYISLRSFFLAAGGLTCAVVLNMGATCGAPAATPIPADNTVRPPFASQCAQNVINCTTSFPVAVLNVLPGAGQNVTQTNNGFLVQGSDGDGVEFVQFQGSQSTIGNTASTITFEWTTGATDDDPCTLTPGLPFSTEADPLALFEVGIHYVRLRVENDLVYGQDSLLLEECGAIGENLPKFDFMELTIEVRD